MEISTINQYIENIRQRFPILNQEVNGYPLVYLDNGATSQKPDEVIEAMNGYYRELNANVHRGVHYLSQKATEAYEHARNNIGAYINARESREVIFTRGTTEGINLVAFSLSQYLLKPGDEILISALEHHSNIVPWQMACQRTGAELKVIPVLDDGTLDRSGYSNLLTKKTRIVAITHVSNALGTINPVRELIAEAHAMGAVVLVDGAQSVQHMQIDVQDLGADFYCFSGHKMFGPTGIGVLWGKAELLEHMPPYQGGGDMILSVTFQKTEYNVIPFRFEAGTPAIAEAIGLSAAVDFLKSLDFNALYKHELQLLNMVTEIVRSSPGLRIIGEAEHKAPVVSFVPKNAHPYDLGVLLDKQGVAVRTGHHCTQPLMQRFDIPGTVRVSLSLYNTLQDIERFEKALARAVNMLQ
jgi:cysteine desulfurase/selenocysteine lyase